MSGSSFWCKNGKHEATNGVASDHRVEMVLRKLRLPEGGRISFLEGVNIKVAFGAFSSLESSTKSYSVTFGTHTDLGSSFGGASRVVALGVALFRTSRGRVSFLYTDFNSEMPWASDFGLIIGDGGGCRDLDFGAGEGFSQLAKGGDNDLNGEIPQVILGDFRG